MLSLLSGTLNAGEFRAVPDLRYLDLSGNYISRLPPDLGIRLTRLNTLNLSANSLTDLDAVVFSGAERLSVLDVSYNDIQVLRTVRNVKVDTKCKEAVYECVDVFGCFVVSNTVKQRKSKFLHKFIFTRATLC